MIGKLIIFYDKTNELRKGKIFDKITTYNYWTEKVGTMYLIHCFDDTEFYVVPPERLVNFYDKEIKDN
jgi:hypothetical protein